MLTLFIENVTFGFLEILGHVATSLKYIYMCIVFVFDIHNTLCIAELFGTITNPHLQIRIRKKF